MTKITKIEAISLAEFPNAIWIQVHTDATVKVSAL